MSVLPVRLFGDAVLTATADPVTSFDAELRRLVRDLSATLRAEQGAGLAAPQVGVSVRAFVFHVDDVEGHLVNPVLEFPDELVNPVLEFPDEQEQDGPEGCLSMPGLYFDTVRRLHVVAKGYTDRGDPIQVVGSGELARCLQHETDHLDGVLFIDRMDTARRKAAMRALREADWARVKVSPHPILGRLR